MVVVASALLLTACVIGEGTAAVPRDSATVRVRVEPGASATYEFLTEAETFESGESFRIWMTPTRASLEEDDHEIEQSWIRDGTTERGWPEGVELGAHELIEGVLAISITNNGDAVSEFDLRVELDGGGQVPEPTLEDLRLEIQSR